MNAMTELLALQQRLGYTFQRPDLLAEALTHRSFGSPHSERLEFLGDGVLNLAIAHALLQQFPLAREGELSRLRALLVREPTLVELALELDLGRALRLGEGEAQSGGAQRPSMLADAMEAIFGAAFVDAGFDAANRLVIALYEARLHRLDLQQDSKDAKTRLQEWLQRRRMALPVYKVVSVQGAAHDQLFEVQCMITPLQLATRGTGTNRRIAEQQAAQSAIERLPQ